MKETKTLRNVTLLATSHNVAKAYISGLHSNGFKPERIILLNIIGRKISLSKKIAKLFTNNSVKEIIYKVKRRVVNREVSSSNKIQENILKIIKGKLTEMNVYSADFNASTKEILVNLNWDFEEIKVSTINDPVLVDFLSKKVHEKYIIYSGGGILRDSILSIEKKFIHVHPGVVPEVKGADCILWSALVCNEIGMSTFFMNKGIDTGDIIYKKVYEVPVFNIDEEIVLTGQIKNILLNYVDPHFRSLHLVASFKKDENPDNWVIEKQNPSDGNQYYFMHDALLPNAIGKFINYNNTVEN